MANRRWSRVVVAFAVLAAGVVALAPPPTGAQSGLSAPATPTSVSLSRADGTVTATWPAAAHAATYHVTYTTDSGASWQLAALDHPAVGGDNSITFSADNDATYIVGVRARNNAGGSGWRNSAPAGPWTQTQQTPAPATPASVSLGRADGTVTATWPAAAHAATYHVTYTTDSGASWQLAALDHPAVGGDNSITFSADNDATYIVGVRARNSTGGSGWRNSAPAGPYVPPPPAVPPARPTGLTAAAGDGSVTLAWDDPSDAGITGWEYRMRAAPPAPGWGEWTAVPGSDAATVSVTFDGLDNGTEYRFKLRAANAAGAGPAAPSASPWYVAATPAAPTLTAQGTTETTITITLGNYSGQWYYSANKTSGGGSGGGAQGAGGGGGGLGQSGCVGPVSGSQATVNGLDPDTSYTVGAYTDPFCGGAIAAGAQGATLPPAPGQIAKPTVTPQHTAVEVSWMAPTGTATSYQVQYRPCQVTPPAAQPCQWRASLNSPWQPAWPPWGNGTWLHGTSGWHYTTTQPATVTGLRNGVRYQLRVRASNNTPNGTSHGPWSVPSDDVWPNRQPSLGVSGITDTTATITRADTTHIGAWYYKANAGPDATCQGPVASGTPAKALTGLTPGTRYQYAAYTASGCATNTMIGDAYAIFNTLELAASDITATTATLTLSDRNGAWYYKADAGPDTSCQGPVSTTTDSLTGLTAGTTYNYTAHSDSGCTTANLLATAAAFTTTAASLTAGSIATTTATLTIADHTGDWYVKETAPSTGTCSASAITGTSTNLSSLTAGTWYTYRAYSDSTCSTEIAAEAFSTAVTVSSVDGSTANIAIGYPTNASQQIWMAGQGFTTGSSANGYTFASVAAQFGNTSGTNLGDVVVKLHAASGSNPGTSLWTLNGSDKTPITDGSYEFTCPTDTVCTLAANTTYFVSIEAPNAPTNTRYYLKATSTTTETKLPASNGWTIADGARVGIKANGFWQGNGNNTAQMTIAAVPKAGLSASSITSTTATLTLTGQTGNWWLKRTTPSGGTCTAGESDYSHALSSLTASTDYTYKAYSDSSCSTELHSVSFTTLAVVAPGVPENVAAAIVRHNSRGYYDCEIELKWDAPSDDGGATVSYTVQAENPNSSNRRWHTANANGRYVQTSTTHDFEHHYTSFTNSLGVSSGATYNVRIRANNSAGNSSWVQVNGLSNSNWACS